MKLTPRNNHARTYAKQGSGGPLAALHPPGSCFPREILSDLIQSQTDANDIILDPFSVGGTAAVEALRLGRRAAVIELNPVTAFFAEVILRPASLPRLRWAFQDVRDACREGLSSLYATTCPKCGNTGTVDCYHRENGKLVRLDYSCTCSRKRLAKKPDASDRRAEERIAALEIPCWHPASLPPTPALDLRAFYPSDFINRRTVAALSILLHAIETFAEPSARDALKVAFASALYACHPPEPLADTARTGKRERTGSDREANPWPAFEAGFQRLYETKRESNQILKDAALGRTFAELLSGRANIVILDRASADTPGAELPEGFVDCVATAVPSDPVGYKIPLTAIQAAWLRMDLDRDWDIAVESGHDGLVQQPNARMLAAFRAIRRAGKEGSDANIFLGDHSRSDLHGLLNQMEKSRMGTEYIRYQPASGVGSRGRSGRACFRGGYLVKARIRKKGWIPPIRISEAVLLKKLTEAARIRIAIHGPKTTAGKILHAFYQQLEESEIASVSKYSIDDLLEEAVESFARYRDGRLALRKQGSRSAGKRTIPVEWRRAVLDAESIAAGRRQETDPIRHAAIRRFSRDGFTAEDAAAIRERVRSAEIEQRRRERTIRLLGDWGRALGYPHRASKSPSPGILWKPSADRTVVFTLGRTDVQIASRRKDKTAAVWGSLSYLDLERTLSEWCRHHPGCDHDLPGRLMPLEDAPGIEEGGAREKVSPIKDRKLKVIQNRKICDRHFLITLELPPDDEWQFTPGQFFHVVCDPEAGDGRPYPLTLRRPLSIHRAEYPGFHPAALAWAEDLPEEIRSALVRRPSRMDFLYRVVGRGTEILSRARPGALLDAIGPSGNGFTIGPEHTAVIVAGGIGIAPLAALAEQLRYSGKDVLAYIGAVKKDMLGLAVARGGGSEEGDRELRDAIESEFREIGARVLTVCTDDGSLGEKGLVTEMLAQGIRDGCVPRESVCLYACGPEGMLRTVAEIAARHSLDCQVSLEERMACGVGACYSCTTRVIGPDGAIIRKRICREGPVFHARDIQWKD